MASFLPAELVDISTKVGNLLKERNETVAVCETAAGGLISASLLAQPGASRIYRGGLTTYTLELRLAFCGWTQADIDAYQGPTVDIVSGLASHALETLKPTYVVAESGTAGPAPPRRAGGRNKTPGYVALAVAGPAGIRGHELETGTADREKNMVNFAVEALKLLYETMQQRAQI